MLRPDFFAVLLWRTLPEQDLKPAAFACVELDLMSFPFVQKTTFIEHKTLEKDRIRLKSQNGDEGMAVAERRRWEGEFLFDNITGTEKRYYQVE